MRQCLLTLLLFLAIAPAAAQSPKQCPEGTDVSFGMVPATSASITSLWSKKINRQMKLRSCLQLSFASASTFRRYIENAQQGQYDFLAAPAHIASYLIASASFTPVAFLVWESSYLYVVRAGSPFNAIEQLSAHTLALPDPLAEASIRAHADLSDRQVLANYSHYQSYSLAIRALFSNEVDAAVVLSPFYNRIPRLRQGSLRVLHSAPFPSHGLLLAAPHTEVQQRQEMFDALASFEPGAGFFWQSFAPVSDRQLTALHRSQQDSVPALKGLIDAY